MNFPEGSILTTSLANNVVIKSSTGVLLGNLDYGLSGIPYIAKLGDSFALVNDTTLVICSHNTPQIIASVSVGPFFNNSWKVIAAGIHYYTLGSNNDGTLWTLNQHDVTDGSILDTWTFARVSRTMRDSYVDVNEIYFYHSSEDGETLQVYDLVARTLKPDSVTKSGYQIINIYSLAGLSVGNQFFVMWEGPTSPDDNVLITYSWDGLGIQNRLESTPGTINCTQFAPCLPLIDNDHKFSCNSNLTNQDFISTYTPLWGFFYQLDQELTAIGGINSFIIADESVDPGNPFSGIYILSISETHDKVYPRGDEPEEQKIPDPFIITAVLEN